MDYQGPQQAMERVITFYCPKCQKAFVSERTYDQPCPTCAGNCADPRELIADPKDAISAHEASPASLAAGPETKRGMFK